eukprot:CAMPEP_0182444700 /NCGR_PEP_ID=MMETSP1172-20130603/3078_1 /TAXON_ID=708627 /ORGANISM="Timspurckia oligopyrenoides, Strain CCMP3278" /LENGTH=845 /DNA_ID=CAMNT_0024640325 /DNA_START=227 /DNA_END=2764 /DNA_ORIENTATION=+
MPDEYLHTGGAPFAPSSSSDRYSVIEEDEEKEKDAILKRQLTARVPDGSIAILVPEADVVLGPERNILYGVFTKKGAEVYFGDLNYYMLIEPSVSWWQKTKNRTVDMFKKMKSESPVDEKERINHALVNVNGVVRPGEFLAIMGPSGSGKSTLLKAILGLGSGSYSGVIQIDGDNPDLETRKKLGYVLETNNFLSYLTVFESLLFTANVRLTESLPKLSEREDFVDQTINRLSLTKIRNHAIKSLSTGELKRVNIANELLSDPPILILDEPTSSLDSYSASVVISLLAQIAREGKTVIITIHQPTSEMFLQFDKLMMLYEGHTLYFGQAERLPSYLGGLGLTCPPGFNVTDYFMHLLMQQIFIEGRRVTDILINEWANYESSIFSSGAVEKKQDQNRKRFFGGWMNSNLNIYSYWSSGPVDKGKVESDGMKKEADKSKKEEEKSKKEAEGSKQTYSMFKWHSRAHEHAHVKAGVTDLIPHPEPIAAPDAFRAQAASEKPPESVGSATDLIQKAVELPIGEDPVEKVTQIEELPPEVDINELENPTVVEAIFTLESRKFDYEATWWDQFVALYGRAFLQNRRRAFEPYICFQYLFLSLLAALVWIPTQDTEQYIDDRLGYLFFSSILFQFIGMFQPIESVPSEAHVIKKEQQAGYYRLSAYVLAKSLAELPFEFFYPSVYVLGSYWAVGMNPDFGRFVLFWLSVLLSTLTANSIGFFIICATMNPKGGGALAGVSQWGTLLLGGYYVTRNYLPVVLQQLRWLSYLEFMYSAVIINEYSGRTVPCTPGFDSKYSEGGRTCPIEAETIYQVGGFLIEYSFGFYFGILAMMFVCYRGLGFLILRYRFRR